jgi:methylthioribose-1-phosphate isomerase
MNRIRSLLSASEKEGLSGEEVVEKVKMLCGEVHEEDLKRCMEMGRLGAEWLWKKRGAGKKGLKVVTVCNTGSLATSVSQSRHFCRAVPREGFESDF